MTTKVKQLLTQNSKLKKDNIFNFDIPAYKSSTGLITCPNAKSCIANCYARQGTYMFSNVKSKHEWNLAQSLKDDFVNVMDSEIKKRNVKVLRLHSSGDIYNREYAQKWLRIMSLNPNVVFYAYTKSWDILQGMIIPSNFKIIQSYGGKLEVDASKPHAIVYDSLESMPSDYSNASDSDMIAVLNDKISLVYHGTKKMNDNGFIKGL